MDAGTTVYRGELVVDDFHGARSYMTSATTTGVVVDGTPMVRLGTVLLPASDFFQTKEEANRNLAEKARKVISKIEAFISGLET